MGNYFNELRWKIIRANNLLQLIHQVTIEIRFRKSLAQERFKSNLEFRNQILVSSIKFWKCFAKFIIPIALFKSYFGLCSPGGNFVDYVFHKAYHLMSFLKRVSPVAAGAFGCYSVSITLPVIFVKTKLCR